MKYGRHQMNMEDHQSYARIIDGDYKASNEILNDTMEGDERGYRLAATWLKQFKLLPRQTAVMIYS